MRVGRIISDAVNAIAPLSATRADLAEAWRQGHAAGPDVENPYLRITCGHARCWPWDTCQFARAGRRSVRT